MSQPMDVAVWLTAVCAAVALGYPSGAPDDADVLRIMLPHHFSGPRDGSTSPYELEVTETNGTLRMLLHGQSVHRGFLITVAGAEDGQLGAFQQPAPPGCRLLANGVAVTHSSAENKQQTLVVWTLPVNRKESTYVIYYTVVMMFSTYWVKLNRTVTVSAAAETSAQASTPATPAAAEATDGASTAANTEAVTATLAATAAATAASGEPAISTEQQFSVSGTPYADVSPSASTDAAPATTASTDALSAAPDTAASTDALSAAPATAASTDALNAAVIANATTLSAAPATAASTDVLSAAPATAASTDVLSAAPATAASTDALSAAVIANATTAQDVAAVATSSEPAISTEQQLFTTGAPSAIVETAAAEARPPASRMAVSSAPAAYADTILVASITAVAAAVGAPRAG